MEFEQPLSTSQGLRNFDEGTNYLQLLRKVMDAFMERDKRRNSTEIKTAIYNLRILFYYHRPKTFNLVFDNIFDDYIKVLGYEDEDSVNYCLQLAIDIFTNFDEKLEIYISEILIAVLRISVLENENGMTAVKCLELVSNNMWFDSVIVTLFRCMGSSENKFAENAYITLGNLLKQYDINYLIHGSDWDSIFQAMIDFYLDVVNKFQNRLDVNFKNIIDLLLNLLGDKFNELLVNQSTSRLIDLKQFLPFNYAYIIELKEK